ncbi:hypothetical protein EKN06_03130 [Croceicoccus ponticola]|uniref:DUF3618 domain-containing protein n=1 Tax=Croceicoccus ponticola TaxID=2217664 RepID=A0A437H0P7_9SPHN|nr:hypothetical protein [Croceicoccus ponticola]RVQ69207.1 hypothetical protein EKN06_03130 [Croceicoccus ponticola]
MTESDVIEAKRLRRAARTVFDTQRNMVKADLGAASVGKRVVNRIAEDGRMLADEAVDTAGRHKTVLTAGALVLTGWFLRKPIIALVTSIIGMGDNPDGEARPDDERNEIEVDAETA